MQSVRDLNGQFAADEIIVGALQERRRHERRRVVGLVALRVGPMTDRTERVEQCLSVELRRIGIRRARVARRLAGFRLVFIWLRAAVATRCYQQESERRNSHAPGL